MAPKVRALLPILAVACFAVAVAAVAAPARLAPTFRTAEALASPVDMHTEGGAVLVSLGGANRAFEVELDGNPIPPIFLRADAAQILYWKGHLVVIAPAEGKAFHFSVAGFAPPSKLSEDRQRPSAKPDASAPKLDPRLKPWNLDEVLSSDYELTRIDTVSAITSREGPALPFRPKDDYQDYNPSGGGGGCATSCSVTCVGGTSCSVSCSAPTCAHCSCPASCSCS